MPSRDRSGGLGAPSTGRSSGARGEATVVAVGRLVGTVGVVVIQEGEEGTPGLPGDPGQGVAIDPGGRLPGRLCSLGGELEPALLGDPSAERRTPEDLDGEMTSFSSKSS